eukprot:6312922-Prymnesium_polylepis.1
MQCETNTWHDKSRATREAFRCIAPARRCAFRCARVLSHQSPQSANCGGHDTRRASHAAATRAAWWHGPTPPSVGG